LKGVCLGRRSGECLKRGLRDRRGRSRWQGWERVLRDRRGRRGYVLILGERMLGHACVLRKEI
jgi:hypothetical protein